MPRYKEEERVEIRAGTRRKLMDAAIYIFAQEGYHSANIDEISKAAGFAKGTVYNYFKSKQELMLALIDSIAQLHFDLMAAQVLAQEAPKDRVMAFFQAGFAFVEDYLPQATVMVNNLYGPQMLFKEAMYLAYQPIFDLLGRDILAYGIEQGDFRPVDPTSITTLVMNIYLGTASQTGETGKPWLSASQVGEFVLAALCKQD